MCFIDSYFVEETTALNISSGLPKTMDCGSRYRMRENYDCHCLVVQGVIMKERMYMHVS